MKKHANGRRMKNVCWCRQKQLCGKPEAGYTPDTTRAHVRTDLKSIGTPWHIRRNRLVLAGRNVRLRDVVIVTPEFSIKKGPAIAVNSFVMDSGPALAIAPRVPARVHKASNCDATEWCGIE
jgi:acetyltransferase-like isoleucine patch superfamily enzyme